MQVVSNNYTEFEYLWFILGWQLDYAVEWLLQPC